MSTDTTATNLTVVQDHIKFNSDKQRCWNERHNIFVRLNWMCVRFERTKKFESFYLIAKIRWQKDESLQSSWAFVCVCSRKPACLYMWFLLSFDVCDERKFENFISIFSSSKMTSKNYFKCFRLFLETWKKLDDSMKWKYYESLLEYWLDWIKPTDPIIDALLTSAMYSIDKTDEEIKKKSESMQWNKNAVKNYEKLSKQKKTDKNKNKQNETEENIWRNMKNNEEYEDIHNTNIIINDDTESKDSVVYWNKDINECVDLIKSFNWWLIDWTIKNNRKYAKLLIDKLNKLESIQEWRYTRNQTLELILNVISKNKYHVSKITSAESIYRNLAVLMQACKNDIWKAQSSQIILPTI